MRKLLIATSNKKKAGEIVAGLQGMPFELVTLLDIPSLGSVEESAESFEGNAIIKAFVFGKRANLLTLAEDSGLEVDALDGRPGVYSARYGASDEDRNQKLLKELTGLRERERTARFVAVCALYEPERDIVRTCRGESRGHIAEAPRGSNGFGYDPIFYYDDAALTGGEMSLQEKARVSHRGRALIKARELLQKEFV